PPPPESTIAINTIAGDIAIAGVNIVNADKANAGFEITGTTSGVANGLTVTLTILDNSGQVKDTYTTMVANNVWSVNVSSPDARSLADGGFTLTAIVSDAPDNQLVQATQTFAVHETLPTVTISALAANGGNVINHAEAQAGVTLSGSVTGLAAGATFAISVADGLSTPSYTATVNAKGTGWTATIPPADATTLKDGTLTVTAQVTDQFGNQSEQATQTFTVHELPTVTISGEISGNASSSTQDKAEGRGARIGTVTGLAAGATFNINGADGSFTHSYTATVNAQGTGWTTTIPPADATTLKDGTLTVTAQVTDQFGNQSEQATQAFAVDETLPTVTISGISRDTGSSASDRITNVAVVTVSGTTKAKSTVKVFDDGNPARTANAG